VSWVGTLAGYFNAQISPQVTVINSPGMITKVILQKGEVLVEIAPRPFRQRWLKPKPQFGPGRGARLQRRAQRESVNIPNRSLTRFPRASWIATRNRYWCKGRICGRQSAVEQAERNLGYTKVISLVDELLALTRCCGQPVRTVYGPNLGLAGKSEPPPTPPPPPPPPPPKVYFPITEH